MTSAEIHSTLGGSSAERWQHCPGSVHLIEQLGPQPEENEDWREDGVAAHALGARCLTEKVDVWEVLPEYPDLQPDMSNAVQAYLNYARGLRGERFIEQPMKHPAFHPKMFSTLDLAVIEPDPNHWTDGFSVALEIVDYKHGVGVTVDIEWNWQLMYYGFCFMDGEAWPMGYPRLPDNALVKLTVAQPRVTWHPDGPIRSVIMSAGALRKWAFDELRPAMNRAGTEEYKMGEWCRFCPAKLVCPLLRDTVGKVVQTAVENPDLAKVDDAWLDTVYRDLSQVRMFLTAVGKEVSRRALAGTEFEHAKLVHGVTDRIWKPGAPIIEQFASAAWEPPKLISPAKADALPGGKEFVAEWAEKPEGELQAAPLSDRRKAVAYVSTSEKFAVALAKL